MNLRKLLLVMIMAAAFFACDDDDDPTPKPELKVMNTTLNVTSSAQRYNLAYQLSNKVEGTAIALSKDAEWVSGIDASIGGVISFDIAANETNEDRSTKMTLSYEGTESIEITLQQNFEGKIIFDYQVKGAGEQKTFSFQSNTKVTYSFKEEYTWVSAVEATSTQLKSFEQKNFTFKFDKNTEATERKANIVFQMADGSKQEICVTQGLFDFFNDFSDATLKDYVKQFDTNKDDFLGAEEVLAVKRVILHRYFGPGAIENLDGLSNFANLSYLSLESYSNIEGVNLDSFGKLDSLKIANSGLKMSNLDLSKVPNLKYLNLGGNSYFGEVTAIDLSHVPNLEYLGCYNNKITELDLSKTPKLKVLSCYGNQLTSLNLSSLTELEELNCSGATYNNSNQFTSNLDFSACTKLKILNCATNNLTAINVSGLTALEELHCNANQLASPESFSVSALTKLTKLTLSDMGLKTIDVSALKKLTRLDVRKNELTALNVSGLTKLESLTCSENSFTKLEITNLPALTQISCGTNQLTGALDFTGAPALESISINNEADAVGKITSINVNGLSELKSLDVRYQPITTLDLSEVSNLYKLYADGCSLTTLDASKCNFTRNYSKLRFRNMPDMTKLILKKAWEGNENINVEKEGSDKLEVEYTAS